MEFDRDIRTEISHFDSQAELPNCRTAEATTESERCMEGEACTARRNGDGRHTKSCGNDVEIKTATMVVPFSQVPGQKCQI